MIDGYPDIDRFAIVPDIVSWARPDPHDVGRLQMCTAVMRPSADDPASLNSRARMFSLLAGRQQGEQALLLRRIDAARDHTTIKHAYLSKFTA